MSKTRSRTASLFTLQRLTQVAATAAAAKGLYDTAENLYNQYKDRNSRTLTVPGDVDFWTQLLQDITPLIQGDINDHTIFVDYKHGGPRSAARVGFSPSVGASFNINLNGHTVRVTLSKDESKGSPSRRRGPVDQQFGGASTSMVFHMKSISAENAVRAFISTTRKSANLADTRVYTISPDYGINSTSRVPVRLPSSVILAGNTMENVLNDVDSFIDNEEYYLQRGLPYHRGYMLEGPPGTGKTSLIEAVAVHTARSLYTLSLAGFPNDAELQDSMASLPENAILVIEDIDTTRNATHNRDVNIDTGNKPGVTLGGLLNCLDGLSTPQGLITFMTTNAADKLDPALLRNGRSDQRVHLGHLTQDHFAKMWDFYGGIGPAPELPHAYMVPASITEFAKQARTDGEKFSALVREHFASAHAAATDD